MAIHHAVRRSLAEQLSAAFDDTLADVAESIAAMSADPSAVERPDAPAQPPFDCLLDDFEKAIDSVLQARDRMLEGGN